MKTQKDIEKEIERLKKEIKEIKKGEVIAGTECQICGVELLSKKYGVCESCKKAQLIKLKELTQKLSQINSQQKRENLTRLNSPSHEQLGAKLGTADKKLNQKKEK